MANFKQWEEVDFIVSYTTTRRTSKIIKPHYPECHLCRVMRSQARTIGGVTKATKPCWESCMQDRTPEIYIVVSATGDISVVGARINKRSIIKKTPIGKIKVKV